MNDLVAVLLWNLLNENYEYLDHLSEYSTMLKNNRIPEFDEFQSIDLLFAQYENKINLEDET